MKATTVHAIAWMSVASAFIAMCWFGYLSGANYEASRLERETACWDRGGRWETTGWSGPWCDMSSASAKQEGEGK